MNDTADEQTDREPIPRAWWEELDGLKPIHPPGRKKPAPKEALKEARRLEQK
jgi:hypothetical protein